jgi:cell division septation protein DedD
MGFAGTSAKSVTSQNLTPGAPAPKPAPLKKTPEQVIPSRQPAASTAAAVVMPPTQNIGKKTASAAGSFGSTIPSAKVAAGNFADFLYLDLV